MEIRENVPLSTLTTFKVGGAASYVCECERIEDIQTAVALARGRRLPWYVLGGGSNVLATDKGYKGVIIHITLNGIVIENETDTSIEMSVAAGESWNEFVQLTMKKELWGIENLAGIPGTVGAAPVQNIGAYGVEIAQVLSFVEAFDTGADAYVQFTKEECEFGYRDSRFKKDPTLIITRVGFILSKIPAPKDSYADLAAKKKEGTAFDTPEAMARTVLEIRAGKFPDIRVVGTAGSFFKNPIISKRDYARLLEKYPELPSYPAGDAVKIPVAWILDKVLSLKGFQMGAVGLYEKHSLILVAHEGATAKDVEALAEFITKKVFNATKIFIEREVQSL